MNTTTATPPASPTAASPEAIPAIIAQVGKTGKKAPKGSKKAAAIVTAPEANPARDALHAKVKDMLADASKRPTHEAHAILTSAVDQVRSAVPDVPLSDNKEQRAAQLVHLRTLRASMGTQVLARMIGDAIAALPGATSTFRYRASTLANGDLSAVETRNTKVKTGSGRKGYSIR